MVAANQKLEPRLYTLPALPYGYKDLEPYMSEEQLKLHHTKHHQGYVDGANAVIDRLQKARKDGIDLDLKSALKELSFHLGGHELHSTFWRNIAPAGKGGGGVTMVLGLGRCGLHASKCKTLRQDETDSSGHSVSIGPSQAFPARGGR